MSDFITFVEDNIKPIPGTEQNLGNLLSVEVEQHLHLFGEAPTPKAKEIAAKYLKEYYEGEDDWDKWITATFTHYTDQITVDFNRKSRYRLYFLPVTTGDAFWIVSTAHKMGKTYKVNGDYIGLQLPNKK